MGWWGWGGNLRKAVASELQVALASRRDGLGAPASRLHLQGASFKSLARLVTTDWERRRLACIFNERASSPSRVSSRRTGSAGVSPASSRSELQVARASRERVSIRSVICEDAGGPPALPGIRPWGATCEDAGRMPALPVWGSLGLCGGSCSRPCRRGVSAGWRRATRDAVNVLRKPSYGNRALVF